jgi:cell shape-determining protein MreC
MQDGSILVHIEQLVDEERQLRQESDPADDALKKLAQLEVELDRYWDLLRQRRARREYGEDPEQATVRDVETVERYIG